VCKRFAERSSALATALTPKIGYHRAAELANEAQKKNLTIREIAGSRKILDKKTLDELLNVREMTQDPSLRKRE